MAILCTQLYDKKDPKLRTHYSIRKKILGTQFSNNRLKN